MTESVPPSEPIRDLAAATVVERPDHIERLVDGHLVKVRVPRQRACNQKGDKGKICAGHLKRWYFYGSAVEREFGTQAELYRCEKCRTIYLPNPEEEARTGTLAW